MRSSWIIKVGPIANDKNLYKRQRREDTDPEEKAM